MRTAADAIVAGTKLAAKYALSAFAAAVMASFAVGLAADDAAAETVASALGTAIGYGIVIGWPLAICHSSLRARPKRHPAERIDKEASE